MTMTPSHIQQRMENRHIKKNTGKSAVNCKNEENSHIIDVEILDIMDEVTNTTELMARASYKSLIQAHVMALGVSKEERLTYYREIHRVMAMAGIIDPKSIIEERKRPLKNSPWGEFVNYEERDGKRTHVNSFILSSNGVAKVREILEQYITEPYLTKGKIQSAESFMKDIRGSVSWPLLKTWLSNKGVEFTEQEKWGAPHMVTFTVNDIKHTYYHNSNRVVWAEPSNAQVLNLNPFWFILRHETSPLSTPQEKASAVMQIISAHWMLKFGNDVKTWMKEPDG